MIMLFVFAVINEVRKVRSEFALDTVWFHVS